jgi:Tfp pilus assembly protein PilF
MPLLYHRAMSDARLEQFKQMVADFPGAPMAHFSLGKAYLERQEYAEAVKSLEKAVELDPQYAAALVSLGDSYAGVGEIQKSREVLARARQVALSQNHPGLAEEIDERLKALG